MLYDLLEQNGRGRVLVVDGGGSVRRELAHKYGFGRIFMSMLEVTEGKEVVKKKFKELIFFAKDLGYETILDVAPNIFEELGISYDDMSFFHELGADGIRLDLGFDGSKEAMLTYNPFGVAIELNMSNDVAYLLILPCVWLGIAVQNPNTPFGIFIVIALLCGFAGGTPF